jgi:hypothetical protein
MAKVYIVVSGDGSDGSEYSDEAVFDNKDDADSLARILMCNVEEWEINESKYAEQIAKRVIYFVGHVHTAKSAAKLNKNRTRANRVIAGQVEVRQVVPHMVGAENTERHPSQSPFADDDMHTYRFWATDLAQAENIVAQKHAAYIAARDERTAKDDEE